MRNSRKTFECITGLIAEAEENERFVDLEGVIRPFDFVAKNMGGLKIHMTRKHLNKIST